MGIGKIGRGLGKVGLLLEGARLAYVAGRALYHAVRNRPAVNAPAAIEDGPSDLPDDLTA